MRCRPGPRTISRSTAKPAAAEIAYDVALGQGANGLRLVDGTLEVIDAGGAPRLRVQPPYIVGADGARTDATLAVAGCAVDTNPAAPWGRAVTAPGANHCTVRVSWPGAKVAYPAVLDPTWSTTGNMVVARQEHTATALSNGKVLCTGGRSTTGTAAIATAELYDPATATWAATGAMTGARRLHTATQLNTSSNATTSGKILIAGGIDGSTTVTTSQLYSPSAGTWIAGGNLNSARHAHTATLLPDGKVLIAGGLNGTTTLQTAAIYNPASGAGSWSGTTGPPPPSGLKFHTATLIQTTNAQLNDKVLMVGGNSGTASMSVVYLYDPAQLAFSTLQSIPGGAREQHTAVVLPGTNGKILVTGGKNGSTTLATAIMFDPGFGPGSWSLAGTMTSPRCNHSMTVLPTSVQTLGSVLVAGGSNGSTTLSSAELFSGTATWTATTGQSSPCQGHTATLMSNNMVLLAGGLNGTTVLNTAGFHDCSGGLGCTTNSQCASGFCVSGVCCNNACNSGCGVCNSTGFVGTCKPLSNGTVCRAAAAGGCDVAETCNGSSLSCPTNAFAPSSTVCRAAVAGGCDVAENCPGTSATCPADVVKPAATVCRAAVAGGCDVAESCNGTSNACPADVVQPASTVCRAAVAGGCDVAESCTGSSNACPADVVKPAATVCRAAVAGGCDVAEILHRLVQRLPRRRRRARGDGLPRRRGRRLRRRRILLRLVQHLPHGRRRARVDGLPRRRPARATSPRPAPVRPTPAPQTSSRPHPPSAAPP